MSGFFVHHNKRYLVLGLKVAVLRVKGVRLKDLGFRIEGCRLRV
jgi:hypothetical protein